MKFKFSEILRAKNMESWLPLDSKMLNEHTCLYLFCRLTAHPPHF